MFIAAALHTACIKGYEELVLFLVSSGASQDLKNSNGKTPLDLASVRLRGMLKAASEIRQLRADIESQFRNEKQQLHNIQLLGNMNKTNEEFVAL